MFPRPPLQMGASAPGSPSLSSEVPPVSALIQKVMKHNLETTGYGTEVPKQEFTNRGYEAKIMNQNL